MKTPKGEINDKLFELIKDEETLTKMGVCKSPEACYEVVKEKIDIEFEDFKQSMTIAHSYLQESESGLLSEDELDQVAGGKSTKDQIVETVALYSTLTGVVVGGAGLIGGFSAGAGLGIATMAAV